MEFWRNNDTVSFDPDGEEPVRINRMLDLIDKSGQSLLARTVETYTCVIGKHLGKETAGIDAGNCLLLQEASINSTIVDIRFVIKGNEQRILNTVVGGGLRLWLEVDEGISTELSLYYHRLVCTNGMIRKIEAAGRFEAFTLDEAVLQLQKALPLLISGLPAGMDTFYRSAQIRLGLLKPVIPVILEYIGLNKPDRDLILEAFAMEPGDTLWHFINAFSRAANLVMKAHGVPSQEALQKRIRLQRASVDICEKVLEHFVQGRSLFDLAGILKDIRI